MSSITISDNNNYVVDSSCTIIINNANINIEYKLNNGEYRVLIFNNFAGDVTLNDKGIIDNANVQINYLQLDKYNLNQYTNIKVNKDSSLYVNTTYLGSNIKNIKFDLYNEGCDSLVDITNNIVCLDEADFSLDCIGTIIKGAKRSKCHQKTHCLTIDNPKKARVLPVLNIDEDDVEASHSLSSGTIDEEVLYYMNSRGLDSKAALGLILKSYLMPNEHYYDGFIDGSIIQEMASKKVEEICSI